MNIVAHLPWIGMFSFIEKWTYLVSLDYMFYFFIFVS